MRKLALLLLLSLAAPARAQNICFAPYSPPPTDPLSSQFKPTIDTTPGDYLSYIWADNGMYKVRGDTATPTTTHWAFLYGTQNQFIHAQVHILTPPGGIPSYKVDLASLTNVQTGTVISSTTYDIITYREWYMNVTTKTSIANTYYNSTGTYPDILIPTKDPYWNQVTTAYPVALSSGQVSSAFIDIHLTTGMPAGFYYGTAVVSSAGVTLMGVPVLVTVWQWPQSGTYASMPSTATLKSFWDIGFAALCIPQYGGPTSTNCRAYTNATSDDNAAALVDIDATVFCLDHRMSCTDPYPPSLNGTGLSGNTQFVGYWGKVLNGQTTQAHMVGLLKEARPTSILYTDTVYSPDTANVWTSTFIARGWRTTSALPLDYTCDENNCSNASFIVRASSMHAATNPMTTLWTTDLYATAGSNATNYMDIIIPLISQMDRQNGGLVRSSYTVFLQATPTNCGSDGVTSCPAHEIWSYQSCSQSGTCANGTVGGASATWPNYNVDGKPVANRIFQWMAYYRLNVTGELYYNTVYCWTHTDCGLNMQPLLNNYYSGGWGDGNIFYPGTTAFLGVAVSTPVYLPSFRMKMIRDGYQDYEIFNVLNNSGQGSWLDTELSKIITNSYTFNTDPDNSGSYSSAMNPVYVNAGCRMHQLTYPGSGCGS